MELSEKVAATPDQPGVYLFKDALGAIIYVGKANLLRHRLKSYFLYSRIADAKTGSLMREIADLETIVLDNAKEALALENQLIKRHQPRFNILLRDDKTYPYIRYTAFEKYPRVYVTRRLKKDGSLYFGPYFPHSLAHRIVHLIHKHFLVPSCTVDLTRPHARPCLQYYIHRCLGPCVPGLTTDQRYAEAARDVLLFLEGKRAALIRSLRQRIANASAAERFEEAAALRDLMRTVEEIEEKQKIAATEGTDTDVLAWHAEPPLVAASLFHLRGGRVVDKRDFFWEELANFSPAEFLPSLLKQIYLDAAYWPRSIHVPAPTSSGPSDFEDRAPLEALLTERSGHRVEIVNPQRGSKRQFLDLVERNARHSFEQRFRVRKPSPRAIGEALEAALNLPGAPARIESFDVSHFQGAETVASMVVCEDGRMKKSDYRKFIIKWDRLQPVRPSVPPSRDQNSAEPQVVSSPPPEITDSKSAPLPPAPYPQPSGPQFRVSPPSLSPTTSHLSPLPIIDDFSAICEAVTRRYRRLLEEKRPLPGLILIDGGLGQLHAAAQALESLAIINQPLAAIAKREEIIYVYGQEDEPIRLDRHSPILHLIQQIRDETHRFALTFHRLRRGKSTLRSALTDIPGIGPSTARNLLRKFGSLAQIRQASFDELTDVIPAKHARALVAHFSTQPKTLQKV
ncbi:MAG: excinuclease ABC subunit UvrC [Candidatus Acidiferrales bacterium]